MYAHCIQSYCKVYTATQCAKHSAREKERDRREEVGVKQNQTERGCVRERVVERTRASESARKKEYDSETWKEK